MNDEQCKKIVEDLIKAFPEFEQQARSSPDLRATHRAWAEAWRDLNFDECMAALESLKRSGGITQANYREPGPFLRRLVLDRKWRQVPSSTGARFKRIEEKNQRQQEFKKNNCSMANALKLLMDGATESEALKAC